MAIIPNPFLEKRTERTVSDQEFARLFSPKVLENLPPQMFDPGVHVLFSPPGGGKTTVLRAMAPGSLRGFLVRKNTDPMQETVSLLQERGVLDDDGPLLLGVMISCAAGYADLPPGIPNVERGVLRALLDIRIVQRSLKGLMELLAIETEEQLGQVQLRHLGGSAELKSIPLVSTALELLQWAEKTERHLYIRLDALRSSTSEVQQHVRLESVLWLEGVEFTFRGRVVAQRRMLMLDDMHKLRESQRTFLREELVELRPNFPVWLAQRSVAFGQELVAPGARQARDAAVYSMEDFWPSPQQFLVFAKSVIDRRMADQRAINSESLEPLLRDQHNEDELASVLKEGYARLSKEFDAVKQDPQYEEWLARAEDWMRTPSYGRLLDLYMLRIQIARNRRRRQLRLELGAPIPVEELDQRDVSKDRNAAEIFVHEELSLPYYFGIERLAALASTNVNELLYLAAALYDALRTKRVFRHKNPVLSPKEQERALREAVKQKFEFIPRSHTQGTRAQRLLSAAGVFCRQKTFAVNAPYAPGVTGFKILDSEMVSLESPQSAYKEQGQLLLAVLTECVAENLLLRRPSAATTGRQAGWVFYLNRSLCAHFGLPLHFGGWQEVGVDEVLSWMQRGAGSHQRGKLFE